MTTVMITGGSGQLGQALKRHPWPEDVRVVAPLRGEVDLSNSGAAAGFMRAARVDVVVNAAAFTAVDEAESRQAAAFSANALIPAALAEAAAAAGAPLVHVSTDYVFDGALTRPYEINDLVAPINVYGASKAAGELAVRSIQPRSAVVRSSWLIGPDGDNFLTTMLRLAAGAKPLRVVDDQVGRPTVAADLAAALATVALRLARDRDAATGVFHFANQGATSWRGLAEAILAEARGRGLDAPPVEPIATREFPRPAKRPANSELSTLRIEQAYGLRPRPWAEALPEIVAAALEEAR